LAALILATVTAADWEEAVAAAVVEEVEGGRGRGRVAAEVAVEDWGNEKAKLAWADIPGKTMLAALGRTWLPVCDERARVC
jgi:hypothetical protein